MCNLQHTDTVDDESLDHFHTVSCHSSVSVPLSQSQWVSQPSPARPPFQRLRLAPACSAAPGRLGNRGGARAQILNIPPVTPG